MHSFGRANKRTPMKSIAGSIVVMAGALIMGLAREDIPREMLPTVISVGLIAVGLYLVITGGDGPKDSSS